MYTSPDLRRRPCIYFLKWSPAESHVLSRFVLVILPHSLARHRARRPARGASKASCRPLCVEPVVLRTSGGNGAHVLKGAPNCNWRWHTRFLSPTPELLWWLPPLAYSTKCEPLYSLVVHRSVQGFRGVQLHVSYLTARCASKPTRTSPSGSGNPFDPPPRHGRVSSSHSL